MKIIEVDDVVSQLKPGQTVGLNQATADIDYICQLLEANCSEALREMRYAERVLYRGQKIFKGNEYKGYSRNDRKSKDTDYETNVKINQILAQFGFTALRNNSIFCTSNIADARSYGMIYYIFPIDGFKFTWSRRYDDFYVRVMEYMTPEQREIWLEKVEKDPESFIKNGEFRDEKSSSLQDAILSKNEIYICGQYYALLTGEYGKSLDKFLGFNAYPSWS